MSVLKSRTGIKVFFWALLIWTRNQSFVRIAIHMPSICTSRHVLTAAIIWDLITPCHRVFAFEFHICNNGPSSYSRRIGLVDEGQKRARIGENRIKLHILNETDSCVTVASQLRHSCVTVASQLRHTFCSIFPFSWCGGLNFRKSKYS